MVVDPHATALAIEPKSRVLRAIRWKARKNWRDSLDPDEYGITTVSDGVGTIKIDGRIWTIFDGRWLIFEGTEITKMVTTEHLEKFYTLVDVLVRDEEEAGHGG